MVVVLAQNVKSGSGVLVISEIVEDRRRHHRGQNERHHSVYEHIQEEGKTANIRSYVQDSVD